jgi:glutathione S-transferase
MTARLTLFTGPLSMFGMKAEIALAEKGIAFERISVPFDDARGYEPKAPEVLRINPKRQVPVLIHGDVELFDSTQIFEYLEDAFPTPPLWPATAADRARARQLEHHSDEVYFPHVVRLMGLQSNRDSAEARTAIDAAAREAARMEARLSSQPYLAGPYSFADIAFFMAVIFAERMGAPLTDATPNLLKWRRRVGARPAVRPVVARLVAYLRETRRPIPDALIDLATSAKESP